MTSPGADVPEGGRGPEQVHELATVNPPAQANPDMYALAEMARGGFFGNILSGFLSIGAAIGQALDDVAQALFGGIIANDHPALEIIHDGQRDLIGRIDLMDDISGYAVAYMRENRYKNRRGWQQMEFNGQIGPVKNALVTDNGLTLAEGTWVLNAQLTHDQHVDRMSSRIRVEVRRPNGTVYSVKDEYGEVLPNKWATRNVAHTVVIPGPGYRVVVHSWYDVGTIFGVYSRLLWRGGTHLTHLSAHRLDIDTSNAVVEEDVPTIGSGQGDDG